MTRTTLLAAVVLLGWPGTAGAGISSLSPHSFISTHMVQIDRERPDFAYRQFVRLPRWWDPAHSYGKRASALRFAPRAGECWCERLPRGGSVEHMRVVLVKPGERIVMAGGLGPLLYQGVAGTMDVTFEPTGAGHTLVTLSYRVAGFAYGNAETLAKPVDQVLAAQMKRYAAFARARSSVTKAKEGRSLSAS